MLKSIFENYANLDEVEAVALGGSSAAKTADKSSDIDIYVFVRRDIPLEVREQFVKKVSSKYEVGGEYFGSGDEYYVDDLNCQLDVMYWNVNWFKRANSYHKNADRFLQSTWNILFICLKR